MSLGAFGGNDEGANPVEYLLGSYVVSLNVVVHLIAKKKKAQPRNHLNLVEAIDLVMLHLVHLNLTVRVFKAIAMRSGSTPTVRRSRNK